MKSSANPIPRREETPLTASAFEIAARVRSGEWSALAVIDAHIKRIAAVNPQLNAVVADRFAAARREALTIDTHRDARPLLGVPFTVKEMIEVAGMPLTFGTRSRRERIGTVDAAVVARLRAAGAIPLGVTNVPEWGMWCESYNPLYGRTSNPWNTRHSPGGSSGGEGAIVGAGGSAFGIGSDIGGSVRMPAAFCGAYAHKPTHGLLPLTGHYPVYGTGPDAHLARRAPYVTIGPLTRSARDLMPLLRVMAGPDDVDSNAEVMTLGDPGTVEWRARRVVLLPRPRMALARRASREVSAEVRHVGELLRARGAIVETAPADVFRDARNIWFAALQSVSTRTFADVLTGGAELRLAREVVRTALRRGHYYSWPALFFAIGERIGRSADAPLQAALEQLQRVTTSFQQLVGDDGVLIMPVHPRPAPRHNEAVLFPFDFVYTAIFNALRVPVTVTPCGLSRHGLPLAVQIAAARGNDHLTISAACVAEDALGGWRPAPVA